MVRKIKKKNKLLIKCKKHPQNKKLLKYSNDFNAMDLSEIENRKRSFYNEQFSRNRGNSKKQWSLVNNLLGRNVTSQQITEIVNKRNDLVSHEKGIANNFNNYFTHVAGDLKQQYFAPHQEKLFDSKKYAPIRSLNSFFSILSLQLNCRRL